jgi:hypothetical protein
MDWFDVHSGAIQALASIVAVAITIVLALFTRQYVKLTRELVELGQTENRARQARTQQEVESSRRRYVERVQAANAKAQFLYSLLRGFSPQATLKDREIRTGAVWSRSDVDDLTRLTREAGIGQAFILAFAESMLGILQQIEEVRKTSQAQGFHYDDRFLDLWNRRMESVVNAYAALDTECKRLLSTSAE